MLKTILPQRQSSKALAARYTSHFEGVLRAALRARSFENVSLFCHIGIPTGYQARGLAAHIYVSISHIHVCLCMCVMWMNCDLSRGWWHSLKVGGWEMSPVTKCDRVFVCGRKKCVLRSLVLRRILSGQGALGNPRLMIIIVSFPALLEIRHW